MKKIRLRYAPSPTGFLHIGNARTALFNYLYAKHLNGKFIIRIEDTDITRNVKGAIESQFDQLTWLGIKADESIYKPGSFGPYSQLERLDIYQKYVKELIKNNQAYYCFCRKEELLKERLKQKKLKLSSYKYSGKCRNLSLKEINILKKQNPYHIRFKVLKNHQYEYNDLVRGHITFDSTNIGDFIIYRSNKIPTYNFSVVIDDYLMKISHVIRGEEHISNTINQLMIYQAFKWKAPKFGHLTLIVNKDHKKLSKRDKNIMQYISQYRNMGYLNIAIINFLALLGWSANDNCEFFTKEELIKKFDPLRLSKSPGMFDVKKLNWINHKYLINLTNEKYLKFIKPFLSKKLNLKDKSKQWINTLILGYKNELTYGLEINDFAKFFLEDRPKSKSLLENFYKNKYNISIIKFFKIKLENLENFNFLEIKKLIIKTGKEFKITGKNLYMPLRIATTNALHGIELDKTIYLLGFNKVIKNINFILKNNSINS